MCDTFGSAVVVVLTLAFLGRFVVLTVTKVLHGSNRGLFGTLLGHPEDTHVLVHLDGRPVHHGVGEELYAHAGCKQCISGHVVTELLLVVVTVNVWLVEDRVGRHNGAFTDLITVVILLGDVAYTADLAFALECESFFRLTVLGPVELAESTVVCLFHVDLFGKLLDLFLCGFLAALLELLSSFLASFVLARALDLFVVKGGRDEIFLHLEDAVEGLLLEVENGIASTEDLFGGALHKSERGLCLFIRLAEFGFVTHLVTVRSQ